MAFFSPRDSGIGTRNAKREMLDKLHLPRYLFLFRIESTKRGFHKTLHSHHTIQELARLPLQQAEIEVIIEVRARPYCFIPVAEDLGQIEWSKAGNHLCLESKTSGRGALGGLSVWREAQPDVMLTAQRPLELNPSATDVPQYAALTRRKPRDEPDLDEQRPFSRAACAADLFRVHVWDRIRCEAASTHAQNQSPSSPDK